jgi:hypothetical protein
MHKVHAVYSSYAGNASGLCNFGRSAGMMGRVVCGAGAGIASLSGEHVEVPRDAPGQP